MPSTGSTTTLVIGAGFLGLSVLRKLGPSTGQVIAISRNSHSIAQISLPGIKGIQLDVNDPSTWDSLKLPGTGSCEVFFLLPPGQLETETLQEFFGRMEKWQVRRLVMASSTVVYGASERKVDADSNVDIDSPRAERQYRIESLVRKTAIDTRLVRLAGLYGAGRVIGSKSISEGEVIPGSPEAYLNLIHVNDAAELLTTVMSGNGAAVVELGCDGQPVKRGKYYADLATHLSAEMPVFAVEQASPGRGRRCDNTITCRRTGWQPLVTDYRQGWITD